MERGDHANHFGSAFEQDWVVYQLLGLLDEEVRAVHWGAPGPVDEGIDLRVERRDGREAHQVKRSNGSLGYWRVGDLGKRNVLEASSRLLNKDPDIRYVFVSRDPTRHLPELIERAKNWEESGTTGFLRRKLSSKELRSSFETLYRHWTDLDFDPDDVATSSALNLSRVLALLPRFECRIFDPEILPQRIRSLVETESERHTLALIADFARQHYGQRVHSDEFRKFLREAGHPPLDLTGNPNVAQAIERYQRKLESDFAPGMIDERLLPRPESQEIVDLLLAENGPRILWVHGSGGSGKSGVLVEIALKLNEQSVPYFPLRWDSQPLPSGSLRKFSRETLELPATPIQCLLHQAAERRCVLLVDQLDALRWTSAHSEDVWEASGDLLEDAAASPNLRLVVACRTFDLDDNPRIGRWETMLTRQGGTSGKADAVSRRIEIGDLPDALVAEIVDRHGSSYEGYSDRQKILLRNAQNLSLWCRLIAKNHRPATVESRAELMRRFWESCFEEAGQWQLPRARIERYLDKITEYMNQEGTLLAPSWLVSDDKVADYLCSAGVLDRLDTGQLTFIHQSYLDNHVAVCAARKIAFKGQTATDWVRSEQSLFRREQVRQLLDLLRDEEPPARYMDTLRGLLFGKDIRFHFRHLVLTWLGAVPSPDRGEVDLVLELLEEPDWRNRVWHRTVLRSVAWFDSLHEAGHWERWLASEDDPLIDLCLRIFHIRIKERTDSIVDLLEPFWGGEAWKQRIAKALPWDAIDDNEEFFEWRLSLIAEKTIDPPSLLDKKLAEDYPGRALRLANSILQLETTHYASATLSLRTRGVVKFRDYDIEGLEEAARREPDLAWTLFSASLPAAWSDYRAETDLGERPGGFATEGVPAVQRMWAAASILAAAGQKIVQQESPADFESRVRAWSAKFPGSSPAPLQFAVLSILPSAPENYADWAVRWFAGDPASFYAVDFVSGLTDEDPDAELIRRFAPLCDHSSYDELESALLNWDPLDLAEKRARFLLLNALPEARRSAKAESQIRALYEELSVPERHRIRIEVREIPGPVPEEEIDQKTDAQWLELHADADFHTSNGFSTNLQEYKSSSFRFFIQDFSKRAQREPARFIRLAHEFLNDYRPWTPFYAEAALNAATDTVSPADAPERQQARVEDIEALVDDLNAHPSDWFEISSSFCRLVANRAAEAWSDETLSKISRIAIEHPLPSPEARLNLFEREDSPFNRHYMEMSYGRIAAIHTIYSVLRHQPSRLEIFQSTIDHIGADPNPVVRFAAKPIGYPLWKIDPEFAVEFLIKLCDVSDDQILAPDPLFQRAWQTAPDRFEPLISRMLDSRFHAIRQYGASIVIAGYVFRDIRSEFAEDCFTGEPIRRRGALGALLEIFANYEEERGKCWDLLEKHFSGDEDLSKHLQNIVERSPSLLDTAWGPKIAEKICHLEDLRPFLRSLSQTSRSLRPYFPAFEQIVSRLNELEATELEDLALGRLRKLPTLLLRFYGEVERKDRHARERCLDLMDLMLESEASNKMVLDLDRLDAEF